MMLAEWITATIELIPEFTGKVFPTLGPVDAIAPYAVYGILSARGLATFDDADAGLDEGTFQVDIYAPNYGAAWQLARTARRTLADAVPADASLGLTDFTSSDLGREVETGLYHVSVRVEFSHSLEEA